VGDSAVHGGDAEDDGEAVIADGVDHGDGGETGEEDDGGSELDGGEEASSE